MVGVRSRDVLATAGLCNDRMRCGAVLGSVLRVWRRHGLDRGEVIRGEVMKWSIVQNYGWHRNGKPVLPSEDNVTIATFDSWWKAWLYKLYHYDFGADPAWQMSFIWSIRCS